MKGSKEFSKLLAASFVSQTGSYFLTLALSAFILVTTGSPVRAALVFVLSYLPSILVAPLLGGWVDRRVSRFLLAGNEAASIAATILCAACIKFELPIVILCVVLGVRSILLFVGRAAGTKWLKLITPPGDQTGRIKLFYLSFFLSTAVAGVLASFVLKRSSIEIVAVIDCVSYLASLALYLSMESPATEETAGLPAPTASLRETLRMIFAMPVVRISFLAVCLSQALFQGAYSALVSYLPIKVFAIGIGGVGLFQLAASLGIIGGFVINWVAADTLSEKDAEVPAKALALSGLATAFLIACVGAAGVPTSLACFFGMNLAYECVWLHHNSEFFRASPKSHAARYQFTLAASAAFLMSATTLAYSAAVQSLGPAAGTVSVLMAILLGSAVVGTLGSRQPAGAAFDGENS